MDNRIYYKDKNGNYCVCIDQETEKKLFDLCDNSNPYETGGILIGYYSEDRLTAYIITIVPAPENSVFKRFSFFRSNKGLKKILDEAWNNGQYYLGEWHYHPNSRSIASNQDKTQMIELSQAKRLHCPEPILFIVGGNSSKWEKNVMVFVNKRMVALKMDDTTLY